MGCDLKRHTRALICAIKSEQGQSTVEYAVVAAAFIAILIALGLLSDFLGDGILVRHASAAASHNVGMSAGGVIDVFCY